jgi:hypothetical protein
MVKPRVIPKQRTAAIRTIEAKSNRIYTLFSAVFNKYDAAEK